MTEQTITTVVTAVVGLIGTCFTAVMVYYMAKLKAGQEQADRKTDQVAQTLAQESGKTTSKLNDITSGTKAIHTFTNAKLGAALDEAAAATRRVAELTKNETDLAAALISERASERHKSAQELVDVDKAKVDATAFSEGDIQRILTALRK